MLLGGWLIGWALIVPPATPSPFTGQEKRFDMSRPESEWIFIGEYPDRTECETQKRVLIGIYALQGQEDMAQRLHLGKCVERK